MLKGALGRVVAVVEGAQEVGLQGCSAELVVGGGWWLRVAGRWPARLYQGLARCSHSKPTLLDRLVRLFGAVSASLLPP